MESIPSKTIVALACLSLVVLPVMAENPAERPLPPTALTVSASEAGNMLSWEPPLAETGAPLDSYNVYRFVNGVEEALGSVGASQTTFLDSDVVLDGNSTYAYFVTSQSASGESIPSNLATQTYPYCPDIVSLNGEINMNCVWPLPFMLVPVPIIRT